MKTERELEEAGRLGGKTENDASTTRVTIPEII